MTLGGVNVALKVFDFPRPVIAAVTGHAIAMGAIFNMGIDWRIGLKEAWQVVGHQKAVQGNLDPATLLADRDELIHHAEAVLDAAERRPGHIFNLGHGILPQTPVDNAVALVDAVHELSSG